ncbi:hypothetical protein LSTR_LSTR016468 [Laodelphax striatellus]|uniref:Ig-like domain-containing protein n=1 Tax=Laodelphax striatellus TaxID=195883 RepID=A0A482XHJ8_LAOST|nr:hypothetical protein LSTR_LSTR016468 [Laodelphax striatellus]
MLFDRIYFSAHARFQPLKKAENEVATPLWNPPQALEDFSNTFALILLSQTLECTVSDTDMAYYFREPWSKATSPLTFDGYNRTEIVTWYRETKPLTPTERSETRSTGHQYWLMLHHVRSSDFGLYTCVAENRMGKAKGTIELSESAPDRRLTGARKKSEHPKANPLIYT